MSQGVVYIIYSEKWTRYYIGSTQDIDNRLDQHNSGRNKSTKGGEPWVLKYKEELVNMTLARQHEFALKKKKSRKYLEWLICSAD